jgi:hypothetical protein
VRICLSTLYYRRGFAMIASRLGRVTILPAFLCLLALTALISVPGALKAIPAKASPAFASDSCDPKVNNIHWGEISGQASIKFVGQVECNYFHDRNRALHGAILLWAAGT